MCTQGMDQYSIDCSMHNLLFMQVVAEKFIRLTGGQVSGSSDD